MRTLNRSRPSIFGFSSVKSALGSMIPRSSIMIHLMIDITPLAPSRWLRTCYQRQSVPKAGGRREQAPDLTSLIRYAMDRTEICDLQPLTK